MEVWEDDPTVSFASNDRLCAFHFGHHIHFTHSRCRMIESVLTADIAQCTGRRQIGNRGSSFDGQEVIRTDDQGVFFTEHLSLLGDQRQSVHVRIHYDTQRTLFFPGALHDLPEVLFERFGIVRKVSCRFAVELLDLLYSQGPEQSWDGDTSTGMDGIHSYAKSSFGDRFTIHIRQVDDGLDVLVQYIIQLLVVAEGIHLTKIILTLVNGLQNGGTVCGREELPFLVQ